MATLREYFETDFKSKLSAHKVWNATCHGNTSDLIVRVHLDFESNARFGSCFLPHNECAIDMCRELVNHYDEIISADDGCRIEFGFFDGPRHSSKKLVDTRNFYIYAESEIRAEELDGTIPTNLNVIVRSKEYLENRMRLDHPVAFVSHDSRDKDEIARPLVLALSKLMCTVWYDEFSLKVGDSLRESIERGIRECKKCILILTPNFISNKGWTKAEFSAIFAREIIERQNVILPVWSEMKPNLLYDYCPSLTDRFAVEWKGDADEVARQLYKAIT